MQKFRIISCIFKGLTKCLKCMENSPLEWIAMKSMFHFHLDLFCRLTQNNWIGVNYTPTEQAFHNFIWAILVHINFLNNSCNFILYVLTGPSFRKQLIEMFTFSRQMSTTTSTITRRINQTSESLYSIFKS